MVPTQLVLTAWNEKFRKMVVQVVEVETNAAINDQPVFYDPPVRDSELPKQQTGHELPFNSKPSPPLQPVLEAPE
jgi:hypothetical protein